MKVGDLVYVNDWHTFFDEAEIGLIIADLFPNHKNKGKGFRIMFSSGKVKNKLVKFLTAV